MAFRRVDKLVMVSPKLTDEEGMTRIQSLLAEYLDVATLPQIVVSSKLDVTKGIVLRKLYHTIYKFLSFCFVLTMACINFVSMKKKILYIVNPISGTQRKQNITKLALEKTDQAIYDVEIKETQYAGHATKIALEAAARGFDIVVAVGGDGTVNEVGRALVHTQTALGIVPCGSGNGLARHLCIPLNPSRAIELINRGKIHLLDYGTINDRPFFCTCGVGFDAFISERFASSEKRGLLTYVENTLKSGLQYKPQVYTIEDENGTETLDAFLIACANASQYGNDAFIAPEASMKDGLMDVVVMEPFNALESAQVALQLFSGTLPRNSHVKTFRTSHLRIKRAGEGIAHFDGDPFWTGSVIDVRLHPSAFRVVVNPEKCKEPQPSDQPIKNLLQLIPDFFNEWKRMPESLLNKTGRDLKKLNKNILDKLTGKN